MRDVVRAVVELVGAVAPAAAEHHAVGEGGAARGDVHGGAAGKVEAAHLVAPARGVPGPAGDGVVDDGGPDEHEDDAGEHAPALGDGARGQGDGDGREHALVDGEQQVRDARRPYRGPREHVPEAKVGQVPQERARRVRKGERVAPEEPLERGDGRGHDG